MENTQSAVKLAGIVLLASAAFAAGEGRKDLRYIVGPHAAVSITNEYGPISVKPGAANQVLVTAVTHSGKVEIDQTQRGNRIDVLSHLLPGADQESGRVDYEVQVPPDASIMLRSTTGPLHAEKLRGDVTVEGATGTVDVGNAGEYRLASHTGDIEATAPDDASIEVIAHSVRGKVENDFRLQPKHTPFTIKAGSAFAGTMNKAASSVKLFSFSGKIHLKKR